ncbi:MAG: Rrf2 family transcriptional regulator [Acidobacteriia bacterium]|nr:Rrf2 family transcriptional regulator [Terriglobia bacterium]
MLQARRRFGLDIQAISEYTLYNSYLKAFRMVFQHASELAVRATQFLAKQAPGKLTPAHEIAAKVGVSEAYLAKILQRLTSAGLVRSFRGPGKGMELGRAPEAITLADLVRAAEGSGLSDKCIFGLEECSPGHPCPLHNDWLPLRTAIFDLMEKTTLADLVRAAPEWPETKESPLPGIAAAAAAPDTQRKKK